MRQQISDLIQQILPHDALEKTHIEETVAWINSGVEIFRLEKPDIPDKHLVSYFLLFDEVAQKILLCDHKKAGLWLPLGGHVDPGENPRETARRECFEELRIDADFCFQDPVFISSTVTVGLTPGHTDISLWYLLKGSCQDIYDFDVREFNAIQWFALDDIPYEASDPHMKRFIQKLRGHLPACHSEGV